ncbi:HAD family hydrolase [archaeon]|nr:MAG: HAD family hydrolase [archaeon]
MKMTDQGRVASLSRENEQGDMHVSERRASRAEEHHDLLSFLLPGILCNDSTVHLASSKVVAEDISKEDIENQLMSSTFTVKGDPTEACILTLAARLNDNPVHIKQLQQQYTRLAEVPFDSALKYMATLHTLPVTLLTSGDAMLTSPERQSAQRIVMVKGAPERVLRFTSLTEAEKEYWLRRAEALAAEGMRVLGLAYKPMRDDYDVDATPLLQELTSNSSGFVLHALVGILDPPRGEAIIAVQQAQEAGIAVKMITGDHPGTALAIAKQLGIENTTKVITGQELDAGIDRLQEIVLEYDVFARTTPEHKLRIVQALQARDKICSMTGDGVNDAPALKAANIGVAMGITGTEVAKDAGKMIITGTLYFLLVVALQVAAYATVLPL